MIRGSATLASVSSPDALANSKINSPSACASWQQSGGDFKIFIKIACFACSKNLRHFFCDKVPVSYGYKGKPKL